MDTTTPSTSPVNSSPINPAPVTTAPVGADHKKVGPIVAILVIVVVLIAAAIYLFASRPSKEPVASASATPEVTTQAEASVTPVTNNSDDVDDIEADLNASTNGLDNQNF